MSRTKPNPDREPGKVYGFVLVLRGLAWAAILLDKHPAALRVLCVAAEYMNQDGLCRVGQDTIAARLRISRQAVNKHLAVLEEKKILFSSLPAQGVTKRYMLDLEGLDSERAGQGDVDERRTAKRARRKASAEPPVVMPTAAPQATQPALKVVAGTDAEPTFAKGDRVSHHKFGTGTVSLTEDKIAVVDFDNGTQRNVVQTFLSTALAQHPEHATSEVAGGAI